MSEIAVASDSERSKAKGGRPTRAAALERDERLLAIAADMFMQHGFEGTSMERLAETAMIGKATLYARYADKGALFADVLRRKILLTYGTLEAEFAEGLKGKSLDETLRIVARRLLDMSLTPSSLALGRILAAQGARFPELGKLAVAEGLSRQTLLVETIFRSFAATHHYVIDDLSLLSELYLSIVHGRISRLALLGVPIEAESLDHRIRAAVRIFLGGAVVADR
jgi:TetR/AcrR family transcriptional repressor of mexJK operon